MDQKLKNKIIGALRKLTYSHKPRQEALNRQKVYPATFKCQQCAGIIYTGAKVILDKELTDQYSSAMIGKVSVDHINPVINPQSGWQSWDVYIERMFCDSLGFQVLCDPCHDKKTKAESEIRKQQRKLKNEKEVG